MKKKLIALIAAGCMFTGTAFMAACGGGEDTNHTHTWATEYKSDATGHWHECTAGDGAKSETEAHVYDSDSDADCNVCGYTREVAGAAVVSSFTGSVKVGDTDYNVVMNLLEDKNFELIPGNDATVVKGTWAFTDSVGYTFTFSNGSVFSTEFDTATKEHSFTYTLKLGEAGTGDVVLKLKDENFTPAADTSSSEISFAGYAKAYGNTELYAVLVLNKDATYNLTVTPVTVGSYTMTFDAEGTWYMADNVYTVVTSAGGEFATQYDEATKTYSMTYVIPGRDSNVDMPLTYTLSEDESPVYSMTDTKSAMGMDVTAVLDLNIDGTLSFTTDFHMGGMNFDKTGTWSVKDKVITADIGGTECVSVFNEATGTYTLAYQVKGGEATLDYVFTYKIPAPYTVFRAVSTAMAEINWTLTLEDDGTFAIDNDFTMFPLGKATGTYTFAGGVYTLKIDGSDTVLTSTKALNAANDAADYIIKSSVSGSETTIEIELKSSAK